MDPAATLPLIIEPRGRLANVMFQHMLAVQLRRRLGPRAVIYGPGMPEWGWAAAPAPLSPSRPLVLRGQLFDLDEVAYCLRCGLADAIVIQAWGMRMEFHPDVDEYRALFRSDAIGQHVDEDEVLINIRAEDIESGGHPRYYPLPFDFYEAVIRAENKRPVFMGQLQPSAYTLALRRRFPGARYLPLRSATDDFQTLRQARCVALSISSFAWLASWLSESAHTIHLPVAGLFNPLSGRQNLLPIGDTRFRYWSVEFPAMSERAGLDAATWAAAPRRVIARSQDWAMDLARAALTRRMPAPLAAGAGRPATGP